MMSRNLEKRWRFAHAFALTGLFFAATLALSGQTLQITSPPDGTVVAPGQVVIVTVAASPASAFQEIIILGGGGIGSTSMLTAPPYQFSVQIPPKIRPRRYTITADGAAVSGGGIASDPITLAVERPDNPLSLSAEPSIMAFHMAGDQCSMRIVGTFPDGSLVDVHESTHVTYQSDTPGVATVDAYGLVTAVAAGSANITVTYAGVSTQVPVSVPQPVTLIPPRASLYTSQAQRFTAHLNMPPNLDQSVAWSITPGLGGIDQTGLYSAPLSLSSWQSVTVTATSVGDPTKSASAQVYVFPPVSIAIAPSAATVSAGQRQDFIATVANGSTDVIWSVTPDGVGTIQRFDAPNVNNPYVPFTALKYFAPGVISSPQTVTVTATSVWDNSKTAPAQVTLVPSVAVSVSPANATVYVFQTLQFAAAVNYSSDQTVSWTLNPNVGAISATGLYTAPASIAAQQAVTVTATGPDIGAGTNSGTATFTLAPRVSASITVPTGLTVTTISNTEIDLSWTGSSEPGGTIAGYNIFHNGTWVASATGTSYTDLGLVDSTSYTYTVAAYDTNGVTSAQSAGVSAATLSGRSPDLVAHYNFNEGTGAVLHDSSGYGNNGAITSAAWSGSGKYGGSLVFDGATSYVAVPGSASLNFSAGMTLEVWVNPGAQAFADVIVQYDTIRAESCFGLFTDWDYAALGVVSMGCGSSYTSGAVGPNQYGSQLSLNTWTHLALTSDGTALRLFVNGVQVGSKPVLIGTDPDPNGTYPTYIGGYPLSLGPGRQFNGMIDEVRIYSRGLSPTEILNDMLGVATPTLTSVSPTSGVQGAAVPVTLTGTNFVAGATVAVSNPGITVGSVTVVSATQITATFTIAANAAPGAANVTVTTSAGTSAQVVFTVNPPTSTPVAIASTPTGLTFSVSGTGCAPGAALIAPQTLQWTPGGACIVTFATPQAGAGTQYVFTHWENNSTNAARGITAPASAATYTATFKTQYQLTTAASPSAGGSVTPATGQYYDSGTVVNLQATPNSGYVFTSWSGSVANASNTSTTVTMSAPQTVSAAFTHQAVLNVSVTPANGGSITGTVGGQSFSCATTCSALMTFGTQLTLTATPASGYSFTSWGVCPSPSGSSCTVTMNGTTTVSATFTGSTPFTYTQGAFLLNRRTGLIIQSVTVTNNGPAIAGAAYVADGLAVGVSMVSASGTTSATTPAGSPYQELGPIGANSSVTATIQFSLTATQAITYTVRILGPGAR
jgi:hypothetical protein